MSDVFSEVHIRLKPERHKPLLAGHPWLFSGAVATVEGPPDAPLARVTAADGRPLGVGFYSSRSQIRVRLLGRGIERVDRGFFAGRLAEAVTLRRAVVPPETTGYRLINAEGDELPGWTVDRFGEVLVSQITSAGLEALRGEAYAALSEAFPDLAILQLNDLPARRREGLTRENETIAGDPPAEAVFQETGLTFTADLDAGQKTGFYCDQRESRRRVGALAAGRNLLDLFSHSAAFGVHARRGGAVRTVHVESSPRLLERGRRHFELNGFGGEGEWIRANVFELLREMEETFDLVVCDPPPLVRRRSNLDAGARAYKDLNRLALGRVRPGGFFLTFSCSAAVDGTLFRQILFAAAREAGVRLALLEPLAAAPDHPVAITHPQGDYLKGWLGWVSGSVP